MQGTKGQTNQIANIHTLDYLLSRNIKHISGDVQCKKCNNVLNIEFDLEAKFMEILQYIVLPSCGNNSQANSLKPLLNQKKKEINWLFLFLGQMIGCCSLARLKYYYHLFFLSYLGICHHLQPADLPFRMGL
ncbi:hypothetical protein MKW92_024103 [Papaver armeniacum]|nr:hypothetical protein MKW92_024103 [Papaver armeniacum]